MARENEILKVGDKAPDFALPDVLTGETVKLADLLGRPLLLYFARGTWCPTCRKWMEQIAKNLPELEKRGARTVAVVAQKPGSAADDLRDAPYPFPVLADATRTVVKQYGVYVRANFESINIARPANFVLDAQGTVRFIHLASIQFEFASFPDILATIDDFRR
jgi:peroxiredoxin